MGTEILKTSVRNSMALCALLVVLSSCAPPPVEADLSANYKTLEELATNSADMVTFMAEESRIDGNSGYAMTRSVVLGSKENVIEKGEQIDIRQFSEEFSNVAPVLSAGDTYAAFLTPCEEGKGLQCYDITGQQGIWLIENDIGSLITPQSDLPKEIDVSVNSGVLEVRAR